MVFSSNDFGKFGHFLGIGNKIFIQTYSIWVKVEDSLMLSSILNLDAMLH